MVMICHSLTTNTKYNLTQLNEKSTIKQDRKETYMTRKVKCQDTGEYSTSDIAFKAPNNKYYTSENAYNKYIINKEYRSKCISNMYEILGYKEFMKIPTYFYKKLSEWEEYGYDVVNMTIETQTDGFAWALSNKDFNSETAKIMYMCAIIENHINDSLKEKIRNEKIVHSNNEETQLEIDDLDIENTKQYTKDISSWLEDD